MAHQGSASESRLKRLAKSIEALAVKDKERLRRAEDIARFRRMAAGELHRVCAGLVHALNSLLESAIVTLDPPETSYNEDGPNLIQINIRGRILQVEFEATPELICTEEFRVPYTLAGSVRGFNQELLDKHLIEEQLIFYTVEKEKNMWRFFDARTYRSGPFDEEFLMSMLEQLL